MALPAGSFSHPSAGRLRVIFGGRWVVNDADPVLNYGSFDLLLRAYVGSGATRQTALLSVAASTATIELPYAGGYAAVPVGLEYVSHAFGGAGTVCAADLRIACHLLG